MDYYNRVRDDYLSFSDETVNIRGVVNIVRGYIYIRELAFWRCHIDDSQDIKDLDRLTNLTSFHYESASHSAALGGELAKVLANGHFENLTKLYLTDGGIDCEVAKLLANSINLTNVYALHLSNNEIGVEGAKALANGNLTNLATLILGRNRICDEGAEALANGNLTNLSGLDLSSNKIGDKGAEALANSNLANITLLWLECNLIGDNGAEALTNGKLSNVTYLDLRNNNIGDNGAFAIAYGKLMKVTTICLWGCQHPRDKNILEILKRRREAGN